MFAINILICKIKFCKLKLFDVYFCTFPIFHNILLLWYLNYSSCSSVKVNLAICETIWVQCVNKLFTLQVARNIFRGVDIAYICFHTWFCMELYAKSGFCKQNIVKCMSYSFFILFKECHYRFFNHHLLQLLHLTQLFKCLRHWFSCTEIETKTTRRHFKFCKLKLNPSLS